MLLMCKTIWCVSRKVRRGSLVPMGLEVCGRQPVREGNEDTESPFHGKTSADSEEN